MFYGTGTVPGAFSMYKVGSVTRYDFNRNMNDFGTITKIA